MEVGRGLVCLSHRSASREALQQRSLWRFGGLRLLCPAVPVGPAHRRCVGLPGEATSDAAVPGASPPSWSPGQLGASVRATSACPQPLWPTWPRRRPVAEAWPSSEWPSPWASRWARCWVPRCLWTRHPGWPYPLPPPTCSSSCASCLRHCPRSGGPLQFHPHQAPSITPGFQATADLLSPLALLRFSAVARGQEPPTRGSEQRELPPGLDSLRRLGLAYLLYLLLFSGLEFTLGFLVHQRFHFSSLQQGKMFFFIGLTMATIQGTYVRRICPGRELVAVKRAILLLGPAFLLIGWGSSMPVLGLGLLLYSFAAAVVVPCLSSVVAGYGSAGQKGIVMGTLRSLGALARAVGPATAASVYWLAGAHVCFTACAGLFLLPFLLLRGMRPAPSKDQ
ncbi:major facilitator superfamily domain-containing protein 10 isoform X2 [Tenrec ecaudatus]|uniref:major facilitator superfamily domain-containing protein 10 isoform X2 n=1 Tax=Tenrec ecaudatus TaxID=94439 RepID=UPI003F5A786C